MSQAVVAFRTHAVPQDFASLQNKLEVYQRALREWGGYLTGNELAVVKLLIDRTVGWGRREAYFTIRALISGDSVYSGLNMSRATCFRVLAKLESRGVIRRRKDPNVPDRVHFIVNTDWKPDVVNLPKRLQTPSHRETTPSQYETDQSQVETLNTGSHLRVSPTGNQPGAAAPVQHNPADRVRAAAEASAATHRARLAAKTSAQGVTESAEATWRAALIDSFPGTAYRTWGVREKAQIKTAARSWRGDIDFNTFLDWAVRNWTAIMRKQFKWMTKESPPAAPALGFLIAFIGQFADCRAEHRLEEWLSEGDRTEVERMMGRGMTWEQATAEIGKVKAAAALRGEMTKREQHAAAAEHAASRKLAEAKRTAEMEGRVPVHPRSPAARRMIEAARPAPTRIVEMDEEPTGVPMVDPDRNPFDE